MQMNMDLALKLHRSIKTNKSREHNKVLGMSIENAKSVETREEFGCSQDIPKLHNGFKTIIADNGLGFSDIRTRRKARNRCLLFTSFCPVGAWSYEKSQWTHSGLSREANQSIHIPTHILFIISTDEKRLQKGI